MPMKYLYTIQYKISCCKILIKCNPSTYKILMKYFFVSRMLSSPRFVVFVVQYCAYYILLLFLFFCDFDDVISQYYILGSYE